MGRRGSMCALAVGMTVVGLAGVSGCGGSSTATHGTSSSSSPSVTSTPAVSSPSSVKTSGTPGSSTTSQAVAATSNATLAGAPGVPEPARHKSKDGAIAFARYYIDQINLSGTAPSKDTLADLSLPSCKSCAGWTGTSDELQANGQRYKSAPLTGSYVGTAGVPNGYHVTMKLHQLRTDVVSASGAVVRTIPSADVTVVFLLEWSSGGWRIYKVQRTTD